MRIQNDSNHSRLRYGSEDVEDKINDIVLSHQYSTEDVRNDHSAEMVCISAVHKGRNEDGEIGDEDDTEKTVVYGENNMTQIS